MVLKKHLNKMYIDLFNHWLFLALKSFWEKGKKIITVMFLLGFCCITIYTAGICWWCFWPLATKSVYVSAPLLYQKHLLEVQQNLFDIIYIIALYTEYCTGRDDKNICELVL